MLVFKGSFLFIKILNFLVNASFTNNPLYHFPITHYSNIPLFQHSKQGTQPKVGESEPLGEDNCEAEAELSSDVLFWYLKFDIRIPWKMSRDLVWIFISVSPACSVRDNLSG